ncbi:uncharacterized protein BBOV_IV004770 [Babesia bovis T2Bo]|uniref:Uncharacterized protein n=1 Tax=Babesia bovis TaxID=5865 RepID=A7AQL9_BABBO|nr:uncharacterized protein BBOV_IV004770 [Babesia bovis T2Bo]EDO06838.1 hypothetical protein BBOV_IV004770 [Babesia bovis T2Bo]BAN65921.1 hypothetical protein [Babesia bovis]|eukprot:XP_001610406.1 hypothetical protein [Babesia bovis T2Bo]
MDRLNTLRVASCATRLFGGIVPGTSAINLYNGRLPVASADGCSSHCTAHSIPLPVQGGPLDFNDTLPIDSTRLQLPTQYQRSINAPGTLLPLRLPHMIDTPGTSSPCRVIESPDHGIFHVYDVGLTYLLNKIRTDTKHRKRAFTKRGYFRQSRSILRKDNRMKFAFALQGIDYEYIESLKMGEIPDIREYKK